MTLPLVLTLDLAQIIKLPLLHYFGSLLNTHDMDFYKANKQSDDMNLHRKTRQIQLE